jgi:hypothetical protein
VSNTKVSTVPEAIKKVQQLLNGDAQYPLTKVIVFADGNHPKRKKLFQHQLMYCIHVLLYLDFQRKRSSFLQRMVLNQPDEVKSKKLSQPT